VVPSLVTHDLRVRDIAHVYVCIATHILYKCIIYTHIYIYIYIYIIYMCACVSVIWNLEWDNRDKEIVLDQDAAIFDH